MTAGYSREAAELTDVDLTIGEGELVCVLGPNGAGKSTLVRVASGLLAPRQGEVRLMGAALGTRAEVARVLAVVEQQSELAGDFSVRDVVAMGRAPHQQGWMRLGADDERIVEGALRRCDLTALAQRSARALSGGEQKRVAIARALAQEPKVLLLDEPGAFLDVRHELDLYELLAAEVKTRSLACLVVMHDLNLAAQFADRVVLLKGGRVVASGDVPSVMTRDVLRAAFDVDLLCGEQDGVRFFLPQR